MGPVLGGRPVTRFTSNSAVIVFHGNSLVRGITYATDPVPAQVQRLHPVNNTSTCVNRGTDGIQTPALITNAPSQVDALFNAAKDNIVVFWEARNSMYNGGKTPAQAWADVQTYVAQRLAANPKWKVLLLTIIPQRASFDTDSTCAATMATFEQFNDLMRAGWRATGAKALVDVMKPGSPFRVGAGTVADFNNCGLYTTAIDGHWVHLNNAGNAVIAQYVADELKRLPAR